MTREIEDEDEIPEGDGPYDKGLWAEARDWVGWLINIYGNVREIALVGLSRRAALRCRNWLWSIEGIVRRLIIAAALARDPASLALAASRRNAARMQPKIEPAPQDAAEPQRPPSAFRILGLHGRPGASRAPQVRPARTVSPDHRHLVFPTDDLLRIGASLNKPDRRSRGLRRPHPLDRRGRISRWDPDYNPGKEKDTYHRRSEVDPRRPRRERKHRDIHDPYYRGTGSMEWRRIAEEWERVIPAPDLAGRIMALHRVMANPLLWITRTARQLKAIARLADALRTMPEPRLDKPKRDRGPAPPGLSCLRLCHAAIVGPDTS